MPSLSRYRWSRRQAVRAGALGLPLLISGLACTADGAAGTSHFRPEDFGAKGDGRTNDTDAFGRLSAAVEAQGGGTVSLKSGATYLVGRQNLAPAGGKVRQFSWEPHPIVRVRDAARQIIINGNGARLKAAAGLRYGSFEPGTGAARTDKAPYSEHGKGASPYLGMIELTGCTGGITIRDVELDGAMDGMVIGGEFGDLDRQIPACGLYLIDNGGSLLVDNVRTHHHCLDGILLRHRSGADETGSIAFANIEATYNGRQGLSLTGGRGGMVTGSRFSKTGRATLSSAPAAGVDIEAEGDEIVRDWTFVDCEFADNAGAGLLADKGDSADIRFKRCTFIGCSTYAAWPGKPGMIFEDCRAIGAIVNVYGGGKTNDQGARFRRCIFTDDRSLTPGGKVFVGMGPIVNLANNGGGAQFDTCEFRCVGTATAIYSDNADNLLVDCRLSQRSAKPMVPWVTFAGVNQITGPANIAYMRLRRGSVTINGKRMVAS